MKPSPRAIPERHLKHTRGFCSPDVLLMVDPHGTRFVRKTWGVRPAWERATFGRWLARREARALHRLQGIEGVPQLLGRPELWAIDMTWIDTAPFPCTDRHTPVSPVYFERLWTIIREMHRRGMNHGDLRRKNLLVHKADPERPVVLDLTQSFTFDNPGGFLARLVLRPAHRVDRLKFLKIKNLHAPASMTPAELAELADVPFHVRAGRALRRGFYRPFKRWREERNPHP